MGGFRDMKEDTIGGEVEALSAGVHQIGKSPDHQIQLLFCST